MKLQLALGLLTIAFGCVPAEAKSLLLDFGPTVVASSNATLSLAHSLGAVPATETSWNRIQGDTNGLVYSDGTPATRVAVDLGRSPAGVPVINFTDDGFISSALAGQITTGIYAGTSPMRDGIYGGAGGSNALAVGVRIEGLVAGNYTVYFAARNTSTLNATPQRCFATSAPPAAQFAFATNSSAWADESNSAPPVTSGFLPGNNCNYLVVTLGAGDALYLAALGNGDYGTDTLELRGFLNAVEIVPGLPATNAPAPLAGPPQVSIEQQRLTLTYRRAKAATNFAFAVDLSTNLVNWSRGSNYVHETISADDGTTETHVAQDRTRVDSKPAGFLRLQVSRRVAGAKVVCFGDSITFGSGVPPAQTWVQQLADRFQLTLINAGVSGHTSSQGLARIQSDVLAPKPDFVIINFGMNDHVMQARDVPNVSPALFRTNLLTMIHRVRTNGAIPILVTANYIIEGDATQYYYQRHPAAYYANVGGAQAWLDLYLELVRQAAVETGVDLIDVRQACNAYNRYDFLRSLTNAANDDDGVHPYLIGSAVYAQVIGDYLAAHY